MVNNDLRHRVLLAREAATVALLTGGRFELGLGAGHMKREYDQAGLRFDPASMRVAVMFACGLIVTAAGLANVLQGARSSGFWKRAPGASRLAFIACLYWLVVSLADTFLSANLPGLRWTMALILAVALVLAAVALRSAAITAQVLGLALTAGAGIGTLLYWVAYADMLTLSGSIPSVPESTYWTLLPWPVLLVIGLALDLGILALGVRHLARRLPGPARLA